jgi:putative spermidine/putrescine transport system ATP-binding protein
MPEGAAGGAVWLRNVVKRYGEQVVIDGLELSVRPGEFLTLLGPSGSGKTTLLMMVAGFVHPNAGDVLVDGVSVLGKPPHQRGIGVVFQNYALFPHLTVSQNVGFPLEMRKLRRADIEQKVRASLELVQLSGLERRLPRQLSGGQQQRVALARAMVFRPPALLMDEPLGALDRRLRQQMQIEIKHLHRALGVTVIYVTHDQEEALTMSDRVAVMRDGRLEQVDPPRELYDAPATGFVATFVGESNLIDCSVRQRGGGRQQVESATGRTFLVQGGWTPAPPDGPAALCVRPEQVRLLCEAERADNEVPGCVADVIFQGESTRVLVATERGECISARVTGRDQARVRVGDSVRLGWNADQCRLVKR